MNTKIANELKLTSNMIEVC